MSQDEAVISTNDDATACKRFVNSFWLCICVGVWNVDMAVTVGAGSLFSRVTGKTTTFSVSLN